MKDKYILVDRLPTLEEYQALREAVGWERLEPIAALEGLSNSLFSVCVVYNNTVVGLGRIVGDGGAYFFIQDVIILPAFREEEIEKFIMDALMDYLREKASPNAFIGLMATESEAGYCERYGFKRPHGPEIVRN